MVPRKSLLGYLWVSHHVNNAKVFDILCHFKEKFVHFHALGVEVVAEADTLQTRATQIGTRHPALRKVKLVLRWYNNNMGGADEKKDFRSNGHNTVQKKSPFFAVFTIQALGK